jgi:hypothetical protein
MADARPPTGGFEEGVHVNVILRCRRAYIEHMELIGSPAGP